MSPKSALFGARVEELYRIALFSMRVTCKKKVNLIKIHLSSTFLDHLRSCINNPFLSTLTLQLCVVSSGSFNVKTKNGQFRLRLQSRSRERRRSTKSPIRHIGDPAIEFEIGQRSLIFAFAQAGRCWNVRKNLGLKMSTEFRPARRPGRPERHLATSDDGFAFFSLLLLPLIKIPPRCWAWATAAEARHSSSRCSSNTGRRITAPHHRGACNRYTT